LPLGNTIGQTLVAIPLVIATRRIRGKAAIQGIRHAGLAGLAAGAAGGAVGAAISLALPLSHKLLAAVVAVVAAGCAAITFGAVAYILDDGDLRTVLARLRHAAKPRRLSGQRAA
jgi:putative peptidoglycan lipid II flippase